MEGKIRRFRVKDLDRIIEIERRSFKDPYTRIIFYHFYQEYPDTFWVYEEGGEVEGYILFTYQELREAHIVNIAVEPARRNRGIGTKLMEYVMNYLADMRVRKIWLEVRESNVGAQKFYHKLGFIKEGVIPRYYGREDAYMMVLYL
jgi:ribosomal-protein-alanine N-acetyltransferase